MNPAIEKTLSLILFIVVGFLLRKKITRKEHLEGVKVLIISVALPATIFIALLKIEIEVSLLSLPILALVFNLLVLAASRFMLPLFNVEPNSAEGRTLLLLLPSLAPGMSCFPFLVEYAGEESLALAALADVGNKVFVLIFLYLLAMHWYYKVQQKTAQSTTSKVKGLLISLFNEPVNLAIIAAILLLSFGWHLDVLPAFLQDVITRMSVLMTPLVLLFIGMAVRINWQEFRLIFNLLLWRSGVAFCLSAIFLAVVPGLSPGAALVAIVFPQSAASFWPFAHISAVTGLEQQATASKRTFDVNLALNVLACSLPFSTVVILSVCSTSAAFLQPIVPALIGLGLLVVAILPKLVQRWKRKEATIRISNQQLAEVGEEL